MARILITGSADGLGLMAAQTLINQGHQVMLHARSGKRAADAMAKAPGAEGVVTGDLGSMEQTRELAAKINEAGRFDTIIHNAGVYQVAEKDILLVNTLAPYILTCLVDPPKRLIYLSSDMHMSGRFRPEELLKGHGVSYSDSKLHVVMLCNAVARKWPELYANAVNPGWVPTKMGGRSAPDDLQKGYETQVWLAVSNDAKARVSGKYFFHQKEMKCNPLAGNDQLQDQLLDICAELTGVSFP